MRRHVPATLLALGLAVAVGDASAQGITLPSPRTVGPSPAVRQLVQLVADADTWIDEDSVAAYGALQVVRYRLLLAPFGKRDLDQILANPSEDEIWSRLHADVMEDGNRGVAMAIRRRLRRLDEKTIAQQAQLIAFALTGLDSASLPVERQATYGSQIKSLLESRDTGDDTTLRQAVGSLVKLASPSAGPVPVDDEEALFLPSMIADGIRDDLLRARLDSLGRTAELVVTERKTERLFFPVRTTEQGRVFWKQQGFAPLNLGALTGSKSAGAAFTELTSPLLHAFRLSLNTVIASKTEDEDDVEVPEDPDDGNGNETELTRFLNGGGQLNIAGAMPVFHFGRRSGSATVLMLFAPRVGVTLGALGAVQTDETAFVDPAVEVHFASTEVTEKIGFFGQLRAGRAIGGDDFAENLGLPKSSRTFGYTNTAFGLMFGGRYLLSGGRTLDGPRAMRKLGWQVGVTLMRSAQ
jgi:hypothetical protein